MCALMKQCPVWASFEGTTIGAVQMCREITSWAVTETIIVLKVSFIGYKTIYKDITPGTAQTIISLWSKTGERWAKWW